jgi:hypothetical protein
MSLELKEDVINACENNGNRNMIYFINQTSPENIIANLLRINKDVFKSILEYWKLNPLRKISLNQLKKDLVTNKYKLDIHEMLMEHEPIFIENVLHFCPDLTEFILGKIFKLDKVDYFFQNYYDHYLRIKKHSKLSDLEKRLKAIKELEINAISARKRLEKLVASKKIVKYLEDAMFDEFEMKPLRTKIDLRKFEEIIKKEKEKEK